MTFFNEKRILFKPSNILDKRVLGYFGRRTSFAKILHDMKIINHINLMSSPEKIEIIQ